jgi:hypothetical protein
MPDDIKHALSKVPILGYALHWLAALIRLPTIRREIQDLRGAQTIQQERCAELVEGISSLRRSLGDTLTQLDLLYDRIVPLGENRDSGENSLGSAEARADLRKRLWAMERRLSNLERVSTQPAASLRPGIH